MSRRITRQTARLLDGVDQVLRGEVGGFGGRPIVVRALTTEAPLVLVRCRTCGREVAHAIRDADDRLLLGFPYVEVRAGSRSAFPVACRRCGAARMLTEERVVSAAVEAIGSGSTATIRIGSRRTL